MRLITGTFNFTNMNLQILIIFQDSFLVFHTFNTLDPSFLSHAIFGFPWFNKDINSNLYLSVLSLHVSAGWRGMLLHGLLTHTHTYSTLGILHSMLFDSKRSMGNRNWSVSLQLWKLLSTPAVNNNAIVVMNLEVTPIFIWSIRHSALQLSTRTSNKLLTPKTLKVKCSRLLTQKSCKVQHSNNHYLVLKTTHVDGAV